MAESSGISWTKSTFNPWMGCTRVSEACRNCYAETFVTNRMGYNGKRLPVLWGPNGERKLTSVANWRNPIKWNKQASETGEFWPVFCASLADVFEDRLELKIWRPALFELIEKTPCLTWQLLTKRPENVVRMLPDRWVASVGGMPANIWIGTTAEDQERYEERVVGHLKHIACTVRFVSIEPQLESIKIGHGDADWFIIGGESGPGARPFHSDWVDTMIRDTREIGEPLFVKQLGEAWAKRHGFKSRHGADPSEWPDRFRVQEFPFDLHKKRETA